MKFSLFQSVIIIIIIAGLTTNLMDYKHLWMYVQPMNVLHLKLRDSSTDSSENSAELIVKQAELSSLIWLYNKFDWAV